MFSREEVENGCKIMRIQHLKLQVFSTRCPLNGAFLGIKPEIEVGKGNTLRR